MSPRNNFFFQIKKMNSLVTFTLFHGCTNDNFSTNCCYSSVQHLTLLLRDSNPCSTYADPKKDPAGNRGITQPPHISGLPVDESTPKRRLRSSPSSPYQRLPLSPDGLIRLPLIVPSSGHLYLSRPVL